MCLTPPLLPKQQTTKKKHHLIPCAQVLLPLCNLRCILVLFCSIDFWSEFKMKLKKKKNQNQTLHNDTSGGKKKNLFKGIQNILGGRCQFQSMKLPPVNTSVVSNYHLPSSLSSKRKYSWNMSVAPDQSFSRIQYTALFKGWFMQDFSHLFHWNLIFHKVLSSNLKCVLSCKAL